MKRLLLMTALPALLAACTARLPEILMPAASDAIPAHLSCRELFPQGRWQMHHAIEATVPGGGKTLVTGVTVLSSQNRSINFALMSVEGLVLFSGCYDGAITIDRAISPFDRPGFAKGLMDDLMLLFFAPRAPLCMTGKGDQHHRVCRYCLPDRTIDIIVAVDQTWQIRQYTSGHRPARSIAAGMITDIAHTPFPRKLTLEKHGLLGYRLVLKLLEAIPLER